MKGCNDLFLVGARPPSSETAEFRDKLGSFWIRNGFCCMFQSHNEHMFQSRSLAALICQFLKQNCLCRQTCRSVSTWRTGLHEETHCM